MPQSAALRYVNVELAELAARYLWPFAYRTAQTNALQISTVGMRSMQGRNGGWRWLASLTSQIIVLGTVWANTASRVIDKQSKGVIEYNQSNAKSQLEREHKYKN